MLRKLAPISLERSSLERKVLLYLLEEMPWQVSRPSNSKKEVPLASLERRELRLPLSRHEGTSCLSWSRARAWKRKLQTFRRESGPPRGLQKEMRGPLPDPLKQEEISLQDTLRKRREFLSRELLYLWRLKKTVESSLLINIDRAHSVFKNNALNLLLHPGQEENFLPCN